MSYAALARRARIVSGSGTTGGRLYYGARLVWPQNGPVEFEWFATHPHMVLRSPTITSGSHRVATMFEWPPGNLLVGYSDIQANIAPIYVDSLNLTTGTWTSLFVANCFGIDRFEKVPGEDIIYAAGQDGYADFVRGTPGGWLERITFETYDHPFVVVIKDPHIYIMGTNNPGGPGLFWNSSVWRGLIDNPDDVGEEIYRLNAPDTPTSDQPRIRFGFILDGDIYFQDEEVTEVTSTLRRWNESAGTFQTVPGIADPGFFNGYVSDWVEWHGELWAVGSMSPYGMKHFDGTTMSTVAGFTDVAFRALCVGDDDALYAAVHDTGQILRTVDGAAWVSIGGFVAAQSLFVKDGYIYVGDDHDMIWRAELGIWGGP